MSARYVHLAWIPSNIYRYDTDSSPGEQDAYYASMSLGVWEPLITKDESNQPAPALATRITSLQT